MLPVCPGGQAAGCVCGAGTTQAGAHTLAAEGDVDEVPGVVVTGPQGPLHADVVGVHVVVVGKDVPPEAVTWPAGHVPVPGVGGGVTGAGATHFGAHMVAAVGVQGPVAVPGVSTGEP